MVIQLPDGALATAVGVLIYSFLCLLCSTLMIFLVCKHREKDSYVALLAYAAFLSTAASIAQQLHTIILWHEIKTEQFYHVQRRPGSPEIALAGPSYGLDLVLFYTQYYCYNVESILTLVWAFALASSIFSLEERSHHQRGWQRRYAVVSKATAFCLPAFIAGILQIPAVKCSTALFLTIADFSWGISLTVGSVLLVAILARYIYMRRKLHRWSARSPIAGSWMGDQDADLENSIYDRWLIVRFTTALLFIEAFQVLTIMSEIFKINDSRTENQPTEPDTSADRARDDFAQFLPGASIGLLVFLVFGTTKTCRRTIFGILIPRRFRRGTAPSRAHSPSARSSPVLDSRPSTFITSPPQVLIIRGTPEPRTPPRRASPYTSPIYAERDPGRPRVSGSRAADMFETREDGLDGYSFSSADAYKLSSQMGSERGSSSMC